MRWGSPESLMTLTSTDESAEVRYSMIRPTVPIRPVLSASCALASPEAKAKKIYWQTDENKRRLCWVHRSTDHSVPLAPGSMGLATES